MLTSEEVHVLMEKYADEFLRFDRIPKEERRSFRKDLCAFLLFAERYPDVKNIISAVGHDEIYLGVEANDGKWSLNAEDILYLRRCGVRFNKIFESFVLFV